MHHFCENLVESLADLYEIASVVFRKIQDSSCKSLNRFCILYHVRVMIWIAFEKRINKFFYFLWYQIIEHHSFRLFVPRLNTSILCNYVEILHNHSFCFYIIFSGITLITYILMYMNDFGIQLSGVLIKSNESMDYDL